MYPYGSNGAHSTLRLQQHDIRGRDGQLAPVSAQWVAVKVLQPANPLMEAIELSVTPPPTGKKSRASPHRDSHRALTEHQGLLSQRQHKSKPRSSPPPRSVIEPPSCQGPSRMCGRTINRNRSSTSSQTSSVVYAGPFCDGSGRNAPSDARGLYSVRVPAVTTPKSAAGALQVKAVRRAVGCIAPPPLLIDNYLALPHLPTYVSTYPPSYDAY